jgi:hypothetical protein
MKHNMEKIRVFSGKMNSLRVVENSSFRRSTAFARHPIFKGNTLT